MEQQLVDTRKEPVAELQRAVESVFAYLCGGVLYFGLEILWSGDSHWTMMIVGGVCFLFLYRMKLRYPRVPLLFRAVMGAIFITAVELLAGCLLNLGLGLAIWNYSAMPYHFLGQICLRYSLLWVLLCIPADALIYLIRRFVFLSHAPSR